MRKVYWFTIEEFYNQALKKARGCPNFLCQVWDIGFTALPNIVRYLLSHGNLAAI